MEETTRTSHRTAVNQRLKGKGLQEIDFRFDNACNAGCRSCYPESSTLLLKEAKKHQLYNAERLNSIETISTAQDYVDETLKLIHQESITKLNLLGGEPLLKNSIYLQLLNLINHNKAKQINLQITTNLKNFDEGIIKTLKKFRYVDINASVDEVEERLEYLRWPIKWDQFEKNVNAVIENKFNLSFSITMQPLNILRLEYILRKLHTVTQNPLQAYFGKAIGHPALDIKLIPLEERKRVIEKIKLSCRDLFTEESWENLMNVFSLILEPAQDQNLQIFKNYHQRMDSIRKQSFSETFPELFGILLMIE